MPGETAVTRPFDETVTTDVELDFQFTFLFVALEGATVADSWYVFPFVKVIELLSSDTPVTAITVWFTVTWHVAALLPSSVVTVIVAVPGETAVTQPFDETVATDVELDFQFTFLFVALSGKTVAVS
jgi:hypothetical protein